MKILSLDTAMAACSAAVIDTECSLPLAAAFVAMERGHAEALPPMVADVMRRSGTVYSQLDRIAVTTGPGTFTGVRIGLAFARGLGLAGGLPVIGIDSLTAIAANEQAPVPLLVVSDARNGEVYAATFDGERKLAAAPHVTIASSAATEARPGSRVIGTAARGLIAGSSRSDLIVSSAGDLPDAARFGRLAEHVAPGSMPSPLYLRSPDAKPQQSALRKMSKLSIDAVGADASHVLSAMHGEIFEEAWSAEAFAGLMGSPGTAAMIAFDRGDPVGFLLTRSAADEAEIITIGTRPSVQRRGVARQLLERHVEELVSKGVQHLILEVAASNAPAQGLYSALGFREAGRRKNYYRRRDGTEDAIVMRREIGA